MPGKSVGKTTNFRPYLKAKERNSSVLKKMCPIKLETKHVVFSNNFFSLLRLQIKMNETRKLPLFFILEMKF